MGLFILCRRPKFCDNEYKVQNIIYAGSVSKEGVGVVQKCIYLLIHLNYLNISCRLM